MTPKVLAVAGLLAFQTMALAEPPASDVGVATPMTTASETTDYRETARQMAARAEAWLITQQDKATGGWNVPGPEKDEQGLSKKPHLPAVTALVLTGMLMKAQESDGASAHRSEIMMGVKYLLNWQQPDGGIYDRSLPSYNTALSVSALSKVDLPQARGARDSGVMFLKKLQWSEFSDNSVGGSESAKPVEKNHPFYGGIGYGRHGRPDGSNTNIFMEAMHDAGVPADDPAIQRALVFLQRLQMKDGVNDMAYADQSNQGGFIYATVENAESVEGRAGQSMAGTIEETLDDGTHVSRLRAYGSMTYAGFKSYLYADLKPDDFRVKSAYDWIRRNYTVEENPGMGQSGLYYYYVMFSRALSALNEPRIKSIDEAGKDAAEHDWRADLIARLATLQSEDGSFRSVDKRWMESDPVLISAFALIALREAAN